MEALKRDHAKKSAMARTLLSEREEEVLYIFYYCSSIVISSLPLETTLSY